MKIPFGRFFGARSGDKGGNASLGVWAKNEEHYEFLRRYLTSEELARLLPETRHYGITRYELPNLLAVLFILEGFLGEGVAASARVDPQAKTLAEYLRAKIIELP